MFLGCENLVGSSNDDKIAKIENCRFEDNAAWQGGALHATKAYKLQVSSTVFIRNEATNNGGAFWVTPSIGFDTEFDGCTFTSNMAVGSNGGAVYLKDREPTPVYNYVRFMHTLFESNQVRDLTLTRSESSNRLFERLLICGTSGGSGWRCNLHWSEL